MVLLTKYVDSVEHFDRQMDAKKTLCAATGAGFVTFYIELYRCSLKISPINAFPSNFVYISYCQRTLRVHIHI